MSMINDRLQKETNTAGHPKKILYSWKSWHFERMFTPAPPLTCHMSGVICHVSYTMYIFHIYIYFFLSFILLFFHSTVQCSGRASWSCFSTSKEISLTVSLQASCQHSFHVVDYHRLELWTLGLWLSWPFPERQDNLLGPPLILSLRQEHAHP